MKVNESSKVHANNSYNPAIHTMCWNTLMIPPLPKVVIYLRPTDCPSDRIPAHLLKEVFDTVRPCILSLINTCLPSGCVLAAFKHAVGQPLLKKENIDPSVLSNLRPISSPREGSSHPAAKISNQQYCLFKVPVWFCIAS